VTSISDCEALEKTVFEWSSLQGPASRPKPTLTASERVKRATVHWERVARLLVVSRLIDPGSEFRVRRQWFDQSAMAELLAEDFAVTGKDRLYRRLDRIWQDLFGAQFDVLLYDLTGTNIEGEGEVIPKAKYGYSPDKRPDGNQESHSRRSLFDYAADFVSAPWRACAMLSGGLLTSVEGDISPPDPEAPSLEVAVVLHTVRLRRRRERPAVPLSRQRCSKEVDVIDEVHTSAQKLRTRTCTVCGREVPEYEEFYWGTHCATCAARSLDAADEDCDSDPEPGSWRHPGLE
jgi:hypothetical protein